MIEIRIDTIDNTYLITHNELVADGWSHVLPLDLHSVTFTDDTELLDHYDTELLRTFSTIEDYHQYVEDHPEDFL